MVDDKPMVMSDAEREKLEPWLIEFDQSWHDGALAAWADKLASAKRGLRAAALVEMVKVDIERQWQHGRWVELESYLAAYPELGTRESVPAELIVVEYLVRQQFGADVALEDFARRFARPIDDLRKLAERIKAAQSGVSPAVSPEILWSRRDTSKAAMTTAFHPSSVPALEVPKRLGRYRILKKLGEGGMGAVYLAEDTQLGRQVALKVPRFSAEESPQVMERFLREARSAATLHHPNICPVYDAGQIDDIHYLTMAYIEGHALSAFIRPGKPLPERHVAAVVRKLALALQEAHDRGIIHRDLKPSNVMINQRHEPVVMDFGLARRADAQQSHLTQSGTLLGTPAYMSPEQVLGQPDEIGPQADVYGLGVIFYELLTGQIPFQGPPAAVIGQVLTVEPPLPTEHRPDLDQRLAEICLKAMAKKREDRYGSMKELAAALGEYLQGTRHRVPPPVPATSAEAQASLIQVFGDAAATAPRGTPRQPAWQTLTARLRAVAPLARRHPTRLVAVAAGMFLPLLIWGVIVMLRTPDGTLVVELDDPEATVEVLSEEGKVLVQGKSKAGKLVLSVDPGKRRLRVEKDGMVLFAQDFTLAPGGKETIPARLDTPPKQPVVSSPRGSWRLQTSFEAYPSHRVTALAFSPDAKMIATGGWDQPVGIWNLTTREMLHELENDNKHCAALVFDRNGATLIGGHKLHQWNVQTGQHLRLFEGTQHWMESVAVHPTDAVLAAIDRGHNLHFFDLTTGQRRRSVETEFHADSKQWPICLAWSPSGDDSAIGYREGGLSLHVDESGAAKAAWKAHASHVVGVAFLDRGRQLISAGEDGVLKLWNAKDHRLIREMRSASESVSQMAVAPDGRTAATGNSNGTVELWDIEKGKISETLTGSAFAIRCVAFDRDGTRLAAGGEDGTVRVWMRQPFYAPVLPHAVRVYQPAQTSFPASNLSEVTDSEGNLKGDGSRRFMDIVRAAVELRDDRYMLTVQTAAPFPAPAKMDGGKRVDFIFNIDADRSKQTAQSRRLGNDYNIHLTLSERGWSSRVFRVSELSKQEEQPKQEDFRIEALGNTATLSFPSRCLPLLNFDWTVHAMTGNAPQWLPKTSNPHTDRRTFRAEPTAIPHDALDRRAAEWAIRLGGVVRLAADPRVARRTLADLPAGPIEVAAIHVGHNPQLDNQSLGQLEGLAALKDLWLAGNPQLGDPAVKHLQGLPALQMLNLSSSQVSDAGLEQLRPLTHLRELYLRRTRITDDGLKHLTGMTSLWKLSIGCNRIASAGLPHLTPLKNLEVLDLQGAQIVDKDLALLAGFPKLRGLELGDTSITDAAMVYLSSLPRLQRLRLNGVPITDAGIAELAKLKTRMPLELDLRRTRVTDQGLSCLKGRKLHALRVEDTVVDGSGLEHIAHSDVKILALCRTRIDDRDLEQIARIDSLRSLWLDGTAITDAGLEHLVRLPRLQFLGLAQTAITDAGLDKLQAAPGLRLLRLFGAKVTPAGVRRLQEALPHCRICLEEVSEDEEEDYDRAELD